MLNQVAIVWGLFLGSGRVNPCSCKSLGRQLSALSRPLLAVLLVWVSHSNAQPQDPQHLLNAAKSSLETIQAQSQAVEKKLMEAEPNLVPLYEQQKRLLNQFVLGEEYQSAKSQLQSLQSSMDGQAQLKALVTRLKQLVQLAEKIDRSVEMELEAEQLQYGSKMYYKMRVRAEVPQTALKGFGLMELARQQRDKGNFDQAFAMWERAKDLVEESHSDYIAFMSEYREHLKNNITQRKIEIKNKVKALLADHFVKIPAGEFSMGSPDGGADEQPVRNLKVPTFYLGKTEVTFELYDYCIEANGCYAVPNDQGWGREDRPVIDVSHQDIHRRFLPWLNELLGKKYRLPSEVEWEYAARAGSRTAYSWGENALCSRARFDGGGSSICSKDIPRNARTLPVASYDANPFGLFDMHGNVWEWVEDCWNPSYKGAPADARPWLSGSCSARVLRGGAWNASKNSLRSANRYYFPQTKRSDSFGFRLAYDGE